MGSFKVSVYMIMMIVLIAADSDLHYFLKTQNNLSSISKGFDIQPKVPTLLQKGNNFIIGGKYVNEISEYPYMAFIYYLVPGKYAGYCGGTILSQKYVLTAAHCIKECKRFKVPGNISCTIKNSDVFTIHVGSTIPDKALDKVKVKTYFIHPNFKGYDDSNKCQDNYDIAILELGTPIKFNYKMCNVDLPTPLDTRQTMRNCKVLGWGTQGEQNSKDYYTVFLLNKLKLTTTHIIGTEECLKNLQISNANSSMYPDFNLCRDTHMCAIDPESKNGACSGDSGGPLICDGVQVGIASWAVDNNKCAGPHVPYIFTRVDINLEWINTITTV